jgi:hypothetical protein
MTALIALAGRLMTLFGRAMSWLLDATQDPDRASWDRSTWLTVDHILAEVTE